MMSDSICVLVHAQAYCLQAKDLFWVLLICWDVCCLPLKTLKVTDETVQCW